MIVFISISVTPLLIVINTALSLIYTLYSSPLHMDSQFSLVVSWQRISTQKLNTSNRYEVFSHSGTSTKISVTISSLTIARKRPLLSPIHFRRRYTTRLETWGFEYGRKQGRWMSNFVKEQWGTIDIREWCSWAGDWGGRTGREGNSVEVLVKIAGNR
jgi:hypothetical protein